MPQPASTLSLPNSAATALMLNVSLTDGRHFRTVAKTGHRIMDLIRSYGVPVKSECDRRGASAT